MPFRAWVTTRTLRSWIASKQARSGSSPLGARPSPPRIASPWISRLIPSYPGQLPSQNSMMRAASASQLGTGSAWFEPSPQPGGLDAGGPEPDQDLHPQLLVSQPDDAAHLGRVALVRALQCPPVPADLHPLVAVVERLQGSPQGEVVHDGMSIDAEEVVPKPALAELIHVRPCGHAEAMPAVPDPMPCTSRFTSRQRAS